MTVQGSAISRLPLLLALMFFLGLAHAQVGDSARIVVISAQGDASVTMNGIRSRAQEGSVIVPPAFISTGSEASLQLRQGSTIFSIAPGTGLEIPSSADPASLIDRVIQSRGSVFYDVAPRETSRLRIETPYLVATVKGTQFNVAVQDESTTISLFEGRLGVETPDGSDALDLEAGEIAIRYDDQPAILVLRMDEDGLDGDQAAAPPREGPDSGAGRVAEATPVEQDGSVVEADSNRITRGAIVDDALDRPAGRANDGGDTSLSVGTSVDLAAKNADGDPLRGDLGLGLDANLDLGGRAAVGVDAGGSLGGNALEARLGADIDLAGGDAVASVDASLGLGAASLDAGLGAGLDLAGTAVSTSIDAGLDIGGASLDAGLDAGLDLGAGDLTAGVDAGLDLGSASLDAGLDAGLDLGAGDLTAGVDAGLDLGSASLDAGLDAGLDLGAGDLTAGVDAGLDLGSASLDAGLDAGLDLGAGDLTAGVDAGLDLGGASLDAGIDAGLDLGAADLTVGVDTEIATVDAGLDAGLDAGGLDAGLDTGVDLGGTSLDAGLDVGLGSDTGLEAELDLGGLEVDLSLGGGSRDEGSGSSGGGLLGGLLGGR